MAMNYEGFALETHRGDSGTAFVETLFMRGSGLYRTDLISTPKFISTLGEGPWMTRALTEADARAAHAAMVDRLDSALLARIARVSPGEDEG